MSTTGISMSGSVSPLMILNGDPAAEIAALSLTSASDQRHMAHAERDAAETSELAEDTAQIGALHDKANEIRTEATEEMWAGIAEGGAEIGGGAVSFSGAASSDVESKVETCAWTKEAPGVAEGIGGAGKVGGVLLRDAAGDAKGREADLDADAARHEKAADMAKHRVDDARDVARDANDSANKTLDWYRDYSTARSQATAAALHRA